MDWLVFGTVAVFAVWFVALKLNRKPQEAMVRLAFAREIPPTLYGHELKTAYLESTVIEVSEDFAEMVGLSADKMIGQRVYNLMTPEIEQMLTRGIPNDKRLNVYGVGDLDTGAYLVTPVFLEPAFEVVISIKAAPLATHGAIH